MQVFARFAELAEAFKALLTVGAPEFVDGHGGLLLSPLRIIVTKNVNHILRLRGLRVKGASGAPGNFASLLVPMTG
jgi:hypothetical protein